MKNIKKKRLRSKQFILLCTNVVLFPVCFLVFPGEYEIYAPNQTNIHVSIFVSKKHLGWVDEGGVGEEGGGGLMTGEGKSRKS